MTIKSGFGNHGGFLVESVSKSRDELISNDCEMTDVSRCTYDCILNEICTSSTNNGEVYWEQDNPRKM